MTTPTDDLLAEVGQRLLEPIRDTRLAWHDDPVGFARDCIQWPEGKSLAPYQADVLSGVVQHRRMAVRSLHGAGKTTTAALLILWFAVTRDAAGIDWKAVTTAGAWRQLERYLWPEIRLWARRLRWDRIGRPPFDDRTEMLQLSLNLRHGSAFAVASTDASLIEGAHASSLLFVYDESKAVAGDIFDASEGALGGPGEAFALASSTPGAPVGRFWEFFGRREGLEDWTTRHIGLKEVLAAGRINEEWANQRRRQWGATSALYLNRVEGEFAASDEDSAIPLSWVEEAVERWEAWKASGSDADRVSVVGVDVARSGADKTVLALLCGDVLTELRRFSHADTMATTGRVVSVLEANPDAKPVVDVIGVGGGVVDRLRELGYRRTVGFNASAGTQRKDRSKELGFLNLRSAAWWHLREQLDPTFGPTIALPPDAQLISDLTAPRYQVTSSGKLQLGSKDEIRKRLGRSPDAGDAVVMAFWGHRRGTEAEAWMTYWRDAVQTEGAEEEKANRPEAPSTFLLGAEPPEAPRCPQHRWWREPNGDRCVNCGIRRDDAAA